MKDLLEGLILLEGVQYQGSSWEKKLFAKIENHFYTKISKNVLKKETMITFGTLSLMGEYSSVYEKGILSQEIFAYSYNCTIHALPDSKRSSL